LDLRKGSQEDRSRTVEGQLRRKTRDEGYEVSERTATAGTDGGLGRAFGIDGQLQGEGIGHLDEGGDFFEWDGAIGVHEAVIAYFHKAGGQDVLKETPDEFQGIEGHRSQPPAPGFRILEEDGVVFHFLMRAWIVLSYQSVIMILLLSCLRELPLLISRVLEVSYWSEWEGALGMIPEKSFRKNYEGRYLL